MIAASTYLGSYGGQCRAGTFSDEWDGPGSINGQEVEYPNSVPRGTIVEVRESMVGVGSSMELQSGELSSLQWGLAVDPVFWWTLGRLATTLILGSAQHGE